MIHRSLAVALAYLMLAQMQLAGMAGAVQAANRASGAGIPLVLCSGMERAPDTPQNHRTSDCPCGAACPVGAASVLPPENGVGLAAPGIQTVDGAKAVPPVAVHVPLARWPFAPRAPPTLSAA